MIRYLRLCKSYGIRPVFFGGIRDLTARERTLRERRIDVINMCRQMKNGLDYIEKQVKTTSEDTMYKSMLEELSELWANVKTVRDKMEELLVVDD